MLHGSPIRSAHLDAGGERPLAMTSPHLAAAGGQAVSRNAAGAGQGGPWILARFSCSRPSSRHLPGLCPGLHLSLWRHVKGLQAPRERRGGGLRGWAGAPGWSRRPRRTSRSHPVAGATGGGEAAGWAGGGGRSSRRGRDWPGNAAGGWRRLLAPPELSRARADRRARLLPPERPREQPEEERRVPGCSPREPPAWVRDSRTLPNRGGGSPSRSRRGGGGGRPLRGHTARSPPPLLALPSTLLFWQRGAPSRAFLSASFPGPGKGEGMRGGGARSPRPAPSSAQPRTSLLP